MKGTEARRVGWVGSAVERGEFGPTFGAINCQQCTLSQTMMGCVIDHSFESVVQGKLSVFEQKVSLWCFLCSLCSLRLSWFRISLYPLCPCQTKSHVKIPVQGPVAACNEPLQESLSHALSPTVVVWGRPTLSSRPAVDFDAPLFGVSSEMCVVSCVAIKDTVFCTFILFPAALVFCFR